MNVSVLAANVKHHIESWMRSNNDLLWFDVKHITHDAAIFPVCCDNDVRVWRQVIEHSPNFFDWHTVPEVDDELTLGLW